MRWLADHFGIDRLLQAEVIQPTDAYFPGEYLQSNKDVERFFCLICGWMQLDRKRFHLEIRPDEQLLDAAGRYRFRQKKPSVIQVAKSQLTEPEFLVATLAHELAHEMLLGDGRLRADESDQEWVTDLLPVFLGLGIFAANAAQRVKSLGLGWTSHRSQGYLQPATFGYALALFAFMRGESKPSWRTHLSQHVAPPFKASLRFLFKTNDTLFHPATIREKSVPVSTAVALSTLEKNSPSSHLALLWELAQVATPAPELARGVLRCFTDGDEAVSPQAARVLPRFGSAAAFAGPVLVNILCNGESDRRANAASILGELRLCPEEAIPALMAQLSDKDNQVLKAAALGLSRFGPTAEAVVPYLLDRLPEPLHMEYDDTVEMLLRALLALTTKPEERIRERYQKHEGETCELALEALAELREHIARETGCSAR
jgi:hypothetical protein